MACGARGSTRSMSSIGRIPAMASFGLGKTHGHRPQQFAVDVHGRPAHALQNTRFRQWTSAQTGQNQGLPWAEVFEHAEHFHLKFSHLAAREDRTPDTVLARAYILQRIDRGSAAGSRDGHPGQTQRGYPAEGGHSIIVTGMAAPPSSPFTRFAG